ncbi:hypothetical protein RZS08_12600, partial [Arthrospira platensis SPKY1]|nr:hypothetical protein [Arthrospira platensis SPKY1]
MGGKINARLTVTIIVQLAVLAIIGLLAYLGMSGAGNAVNQVNQSVSEQVSLGRLGDTLRTDLLATANSVARGARTWDDGENTLRVA